MATLPPGAPLSTMPQPDPTMVSTPVVAVRQPDRAQERARRLAAQYTALCTQAQQRFRLAETFESPWRQRAIEDGNFAAGEQWDASVLRSRQDPRNPRPALTINQTGRFIHQLTNDGQQNRPAIKVRPVDSLSDVDTAKVYDGLIRHICVTSDFDVAQDTAYDHAVRMGRGYWRVCTDYESAWSFQQVIRLERILNPFAVYLDPAGRQHPDYHTADWGFVVGRLPRDVICEKYEITAQTWTAWTSLGNHWVSQDEATVADYYYREQLSVELCQLQSGEVRYIPRLRDTEADPDDEEDDAEARLLDVIAWRMARQGVFPLTQDVARQVTRTRRSALPVIMQCKMVGVDFLEPPMVWPGQYIPIVPVLGEEVMMGEELDYRGIVRDMKDAQRSFNYWTTMAAETVALAPRAPWIATARQIQNHEAMWRTANTTPWSVLVYNKDVDGGVAAAPPQRNAVEPPIQAIGYMIGQAGQALYATSGIQPADLGEASNEKSGRHAQIRKQESELGTSHFRTHFVWAVRHTGRILIDLIPQVYSEPGRILRILGEDNQESSVMMHPQAAQLQEQKAPMPAGVDSVYNLGVGMYDLVVDTGPNYLTQRQESAANMIDIAQAIPKAGDVLPDLIVGMQDFPEAEEAARRLKKTVPPELLDDELGDAKPEEQVPLLAAQLKKKSMEAQAINAHAGQVEQQLQALMQDNQKLQAAQQSKQGELLLKQQELALRQQELDLQRYELDVKKYEIDERSRVELAKAQIERQTEVLEAREEG